MKRDASDRDSDKSEKPNQLKLMNAIAAQMRPLLDDPRRRARANASILKTLTRHLGDSETELPLVANTPDQEKQADVLSAYLALASLQGSFSQCEFYFRRFPFSGLPINRAEHLRNVCEMYFDRIEQFRDRLKRLMNSLKAYAGDTDDRYGELIKQYGKEFRWECKQRNLTHHHRRFEYDAIDQLGLIDILGKSENLAGRTELADLLPDLSTIYRQEARKWVGRVKNHSKILDTIVEFASGLVLEKCDFLNEPGN